MRVLKFGGTSVANAERFLRVADILESNARQGQVATVLSAPAKITNHLVAMVAEQPRDFSTAGLRSAVCSTARPSVVLILSPLNIAARHASISDSLANSNNLAKISSSRLFFE